MQVILRMSVKENLQTTDSSLGGSLRAEPWVGGTEGSMGVSSGVSQEVSAWEDLTD